MAAPDSLVALKSRPHPLGWQVDLQWWYPNSLPENWQLLLFRKAGQAVSDAEINTYISQGSPAEGVSAFVFTATGQDRHFDQEVQNGTAYHYAAVIHNTDSDEISDKSAVESTPAYSAQIQVTDCKEAILSAVEKLMRNHSIVPEKDVFIQKVYAITDTKLPRITIVRTENNIYQEFTGHVVDWEGDQLSQGQIDQDNIQIIWNARSDRPDQRDYMTNLFRAALPEIRNRLYALGGIIAVHSAIGGDFKDERWESGYVAANSMAIHCVLQSKQTMEDGLWRETAWKPEYQGQEGS